MIFGNNQDSTEKIEQQLFVNFNLLPSFSRRYVHICNKSLRIWTVSLNTESKNTPVVLIHGFGGNPIVSEMQFIESIENWRKELDIKEMVLLGHSFGSYLICSYSIKYPDRTKALILFDPWGFVEQVPSD
jgi:pimeloyl-ACP methyl ester carboxylesterase